METKENKQADKETMESASGDCNPECGQETGPAQGENKASQPGPVPGQMPFPYGYFQSPNLHPGDYMAQGGLPQGPMPGYFVYIQPGPGQMQGGANPGNPANNQPQGQSVNPGSEASQATPGGATGGQDNGGLKAHDAPQADEGQGNSGCSQDDNHSGHATLTGHHKEPEHDELKYGTYMDGPGHEAPGQEQDMTGDIPASSGLGSFFQLDNDSYWKGILVGSLVTLLLTNAAVKKGIMKTVIKASASVKGGIEELKEQLGDLEAEVLHELNEKKK